MNKRIISTFKQGSGDFGHSLLLDGHHISKSDPSCQIYSYIEHLNNLISEVIYYNDIKFKSLLNTLKWLKSNSFSISSFCFLKGNSTKHVISNLFLEELIKEIDLLKEDEILSSSTDFTIHNNIKFIRLDKIRILVRDVERGFTIWREHDIITNYIINTLVKEPMLAQSIVININNYGTYLNRLSTFIWLATRKESQLSNSFNSIENWKGEINHE